MSATSVAARARFTSMVAPLGGARVEGLDIHDGFLRKAVAS